MGDPASLTRRRSRSLAARCPSMHPLWLPSNAAAAACRSRQRPQALSASSVFVGVRQWRGPDCRPRAAPHAGVAPGYRESTSPPRQSGSAPGCCQVVHERIGTFAETVCRLGCAPIAPKQRHGVPCLARCISPPAAIRSRRGTSVAVFPRPGRARPGRRPGCPEARPAARTTGCPDDGRNAAVYAELLRRAQDMPWTSGWPRRGRLGRHPSATHCTRIISASPAQSS